VNDSGITVIVGTLSAIPWRQQAIFRGDDGNVRFILDQHV